LLNVNMLMCAGRRLLFFVYMFSYRIITMIYIITCTNLLNFRHRPHNMRSRVYVTVGCPSVCLSHYSTAAATCSGFAAERPRAGDIDRQRRAPDAQQQRRRSTALSSKCEQCHVDSKVEHMLVNIKNSMYPWCYAISKLSS